MALVLENGNATCSENEGQCSERAVSSLFVQDNFEVEFCIFDTVANDSQIQLRRP